MSAVSGKSSWRCAVYQVSPLVDTPAWLLYAVGYSIFCSTRRYIKPGPLHPPTLYCTLYLPLRWRWMVKWDVSKSKDPGSIRGLVFMWLPCIAFNWQLLKQGNKTVWSGVSIIWLGGCVMSGVFGLILQWWKHEFAVKTITQYKTLIMHTYIQVKDL